MFFLRQRILYIGPAILLIAIHYSVTNNPLWQLLLIGVSFSLILAASVRLLSTNNTTRISRTTVTLVLLLAFYLLDSVYLVASVFTADGFTEQTLAHLNLNSLKSGGNTQFAPYHAATAAMMVLVIAVWLLIKYIKPDMLINRGKYRVLLLVVLGFTVHPGIADLSKLWWNSVQLRDMDVTLLSTLETAYIPTSSLQNTLKQRSKTQKNSIVLIYLESFEKTYLDQQAFPNLANHLAELDSSEQTYGKFESTFFAKHTIAGLVSSLCGVPYAATGSGNGNVLNNGAGNYYMPHVQCLGDMTKQLGYDNIYYQGGDLSFTQKGVFFKSHGYDEVKGIHELWPDAPKEKRTSWGLHDDVLFGFAKKRIAELVNSKSKRPFLFTLLTLDTHDPYGRNKISRSCVASGKASYKGRKDHPIQDQVHCSDFLLGEFVQDLRDNYGDSLDIYLVADHLAHSHSQGDILREKKERDLIFINVSQAKRQNRNRHFTHLDIPATILDDTTGGFLTKLGLGVSLNQNEQTLLEKWGAETFNNKIQDNLPSLAERYWKYPSIKDQPFAFNDDSYEFSFSDTSFPLPILFSLDDDNEIKSYHSFEINQYLKISSGINRMLTIQKCGQLSIYQSNDFPVDSFCLMVGNLGSESLSITPVKPGQEYYLRDYLDFLDLESNSDRLRTRLFEQKPGYPQLITSAGSAAISPIAEAQFVTGKESNTRMVTNYWNYSLFDKFRGFKNHGPAKERGLHLFEIESGRVQRLKHWTSCATLKQDDLESIITRSGSNEFVLMSGRGSIECPDYVSNTRFKPQISSMKQGQSLIAYLNLKTDNYQHISNEEGKTIQLNLVDDEFYSQHVN